MQRARAHAHTDRSPVGKMSISSNISSWYFSSLHHPRVFLLSLFASFSLFLFIFLFSFLFHYGRSFDTFCVFPPKVSSPASSSSNSHASLFLSIRCLFSILSCRGSAACMLPLDSRWWLCMDTSSTDLLLLGVVAAWPVITSSM